MSGEICQVFTHQRVNAGVVFGGVPADGGQNVVIHAESDVPHMHSIRVTVSGRQPPDAPVPNGSAVKLYFDRALPWAVIRCSLARVIFLMNSTRRKRRADQSSSMATPRTGSKPASL